MFFFFFCSFFVLFLLYERTNLQVSTLRLPSQTSLFKDKRLHMSQLACICSLKYRAVERKQNLINGFQYIDRAREGE